MPDKAGPRIEDRGLSKAVEIEKPAITPTPSINVPPSIPSGTLLAFDFGTKRIGIAVGNTISGTAQPLTTIADEKNDARFATIASLIKEWGPTALVVGLPCNDDGTPQDRKSVV